MRSSSASCRTRSLKSSHDSSRFAYSSVESSAISVTSAKRILLLALHCNREVPPAPFAHEARVENVASRAEVDDERLEAAIEQPVRRLASGLRIEILRALAGFLAQPGRVVEPEPLDVALDARDRLVAVVYLAEEVLELLGLLRVARGRLAEHGRRELEHVAQPFGGDAHVVQVVDVARVERTRTERAQFG